MAGPALIDVPDRYDVVFQLNNGTTYGFLLADSVESNLPFRTHKALYSYSPTFLERQNVSQQYGDNFQDFFLTGSQDDFSLGEMQKFFRVNDASRSRRYFSGSNIDPTTVPGNVTLTKKLTTLTQSGITAICANSVNGPSSMAWFMVDGTNLYGVSTAGVISTIGAHGAGTVNDMTMDETNLYIAGTTATRKWDNVTFTTFGAGIFSKLVYLNNILYGWASNPDKFYSTDTSGNPTQQFQWLNADGGFSTNVLVRSMVPYGGSVFFLRRGPTNGEIWTYDGLGVKKLADLPQDFFVSKMCVSQGIVFISGYIRYLNRSQYFPQVYYYANGTIGKLWDSGTSFATSETEVGIGAYGNGVVFCDTSSGDILQYDTAYGGVHTIANSANVAAQIVPANRTSAFLLWTSSGVSTISTYGVNASYNSTGVIQTSQYDFDNTLSKVIRGIKIDADIPANTSIDLAYQLDGCGGTYTTLQTGATSGTEYLLPASTSAHSISVQITFNSATGAATPTLKRVYVRAAPTLQQFRRREYLFDLSGGLRDELGESSRRCRDGTPYPYDPKTAANNLRTIATQTIPLTVQDRFDQFTALADLQENSEGYDGFAIYEIRPDVFIGRINLREV